MTRSELRQLVRDLTLTEEHEVSDALIDRFLKEGYDKVLHRQRWSWLLQVPEFHAPVAWPFDMSVFALTPLAIYDIVESSGNGLPLTQITRSEATFFFNGNVLGARSRVYWVEGMFLYALPETTDVDYRISYYADPGWADGDDQVPVVPEAFQPSTIANFATSRVWERQEDFDRADAYMDRYDMGLTELIYAENTRRRDRPKVFGEIVGARGGNRHMPWLDGV